MGIKADRTHKMMFDGCLVWGWSALDMSWIFIMPVHLESCSSPAGINGMNLEAVFHHIMAVYNGLTVFIYMTYMSGWWFQTWLLFSTIYGMSSFPLTFIFFKMVKTTNQNTTTYFAAHGWLLLSQRLWNAPPMPGSTRTWQKRRRQLRLTVCSLSPLIFDTPS